MKKFLSVLMAATMLVGVMALTGCGGNSEPAGKYVAGTYTRLHHRHRPEDRHRGRAHHVHQRGFPAL